MFRESFYVLLILSLCLEYVLNQHSNDGIAYSHIPMRPIVPQRTRRPTIKPVVTNRPRRPSLPSQGGSRYLHRRKPGKKNLDKETLLEMMGNDYQASWMSYEKPQKKMISVPSSEVPDLEGMTGQWVQERLLEQFQELNLTAEISTLQPELLAMEDSIKSWLLKRSSCPVEFTWKDLGPTFWPRWVREGTCLDRKGSCSFPTGMHCVPAASTTVHILRWQCRGRKMTVFKKSADSADKKILGEGEEVVQKRQRGRRPKPMSETPGSVLHTRQLADRLSAYEQSKEYEKNQRPVPQNRQRDRRSKPISETSDRVLHRGQLAGRLTAYERSEEYAKYQRPVPEFSDHQRRNKRCNWFRVPFPITINCFCTC